jgi:hypothetical protein
MRPGKLMGFVGALTLTAALGVATPAAAATVGPYWCGSADAAVNGSTEGDGQITFIPGAPYGHCGTLGIRVYYTHVGGGTWTGWSHSSNGGGHVRQNVGNSAYMSQHTTTLGSNNFYSPR